MADSLSTFQSHDMSSSSRQDESIIFHGNSVIMLGRRPLSDSSIKYEENAFHDSSEVKLVHFSERKNSLSTPGSSDADGEASDDGAATSSLSRSLASSTGLEVMQHTFLNRSRNGTKSSFNCDCQESQKAKRKMAKKLTASTASVAFPFPVLQANGESVSRHRRKDLSFVNRVKKWFSDSGSTANSESDGVGSSKWKSTFEAGHSTSRSTKKDVQKKDRHFIIGDILAITNCSYYWGSINRHEAEELLVGKPDGTFLLRDSAHKEHLFSVSFRRYSKTLHARIEQWDHKYSFDRESPIAYYSVTIEGLLSHYSIGEYCMFFEPMLINPLVRRQPQPLMGLCRGVIGHYTSYEDVESLPIPSSMKTFLREYNYCIKPKSKKDESDGKRKRNSTLCLF